MADLDQLDEQMDARLRQRGERWHDEQPDASRLDPTRLAPPARHPARWWIVAAVAAVVVALIVGVHALVGRPARVDRPVSPTGPQQVVPWKPLPPTDPQIPTYTSPAVPDPGAARAARPCRTSDLRAGHGSLDGAGGTLLVSVDVFARSGVSCRVEGYPRIGALDHGRHVDVAIERGMRVYRDPVLVSPHRPAVLTMTWADWCAAPLSTDTLTAAMPDGGALTWRGFGHSPSCQSGVPGRRGPIRVEPFAPQRRHAAQVSSRYDEIRATGEVPRTARFGTTVRFTVTLTSPRRLGLHPCPDFTLAAYWSGDSETTTSALNCAAIPSHDEHGSAVLPAGQPVRFAVQLPARTVGRAKVIWSLHTHRTMAVAVAGELSVVGGHGD